jgi:hypothetical protein
MIKKPKIEFNEIEALAVNLSFFEVKSYMKAMTESAMNRKFKTSFEDTLTKLSHGLVNKSVIKKEEIINRKIGKVQQKYFSITRHNPIDLLIDEKNRQGKRYNMASTKKSKRSREKTRCLFYKNNSKGER